MTAMLDVNPGTIRKRGRWLDTISVPAIPTHAARSQLGMAETFAPVGEEPATPSVVTAAKRICKRCPILRQCRTWALATNQTGGV